MFCHALRGNFANFHHLVQHAVQAHGEPKTGEGSGMTSGDHRHIGAIDLTVSAPDRHVAVRARGRTRRRARHAQRPAQRITCRSVRHRLSPYLDVAFLDGAERHFNGPIVVGERAVFFVAGEQQGDRAGKLVLVRAARDEHHGAVAGVGTANLDNGQCDVDHRSVARDHLRRETGGRAGPENRFEPLDKRRPLPGR